jgi:hypothetical protein
VLSWGIRTAIWSTARSDVSELVVGSDNVQRRDVELTIIDQPHNVAVANSISRDGNGVFQCPAGDEDLDERSGIQRELAVGRIERPGHLDDNRHHARHPINLPGRAGDVTDPLERATRKIRFQRGCYRLIACRSVS